ncbi:zinc-binding dehydrogenase [Gemmatimonadetes bacterium T265]|nr:zinc-binding dehydrogenase [Gemmatimonadetes bacterium T265]
MKAAIVDAFDRPPRYGDVPTPTAADGEVVVHVAAAAASQLVRAQAAGRHYSSPARLPFVPGVDGVGRLDDGRRVYCAFPRVPHGTMAERTVVPRDAWVEVPDAVDDVTAAAIANPGMSSWAALVERARFVAGEAVLVNGATGASGRLAIQIARHLGARCVVATGRTAASVAPLAALGADRTIPLDQPADVLVDLFRRELREEGIDVVLDYLWGPSAEHFITACAGHGAGAAEPRVRFVQIGTLAAPTVTLPGAALRSSGLELLGSGLGSVSNAALVRAIGAMLRAVGPAGLTIAADPVPLADVKQAWADDRSGRLVLTV